MPKYSSFKEQQILTENFRKFIQESGDDRPDQYKDELYKLGSELRNIEGDSVDMHRRGRGGVVIFTKHIHDGYKAGIVQSIRALRNIDETMAKKLEDLLGDVNGWAGEESKIAELEQEKADWFFKTLDDAGDLLMAQSQSEQPGFRGEEI